MQVAPPVTVVSVTRHRPAVQSALHDRPHPPQLFESVCSFTHEPPHAVSPMGHAQTSSWHVAVDGQTLPHAPQLFGSVCSSESEHTPLVAAPLEPDPLFTPELAALVNPASRPPQAKPTISARPSGIERASRPQVARFLVLDGIAPQNLK